MVQHRTIAILRSDPDPVDPRNSRLTLSDDGETVVNPGDVVNWIIDKDCKGITSILIYDDNSRFDVFSPDPAPVAGGSHWTAVVNPNHKGGRSEQYTIYWSEEGIIYSFDPIIKINPK